MKAETGGLCGRLVPDINVIEFMMGPAHREIQL